jgi:hypothetical protein
VRKGANINVLISFYFLPYYRVTLVLFTYKSAVLTALLHCFVTCSRNTNHYVEYVEAKYNYSCQNPHEHDGAQHSIQLLRASGTKIFGKNSVTTLVLCTVGSQKIPGMMVLHSNDRIYDNA